MITFCMTANLQVQLHCMHCHTPFVLLLVLHRCCYEVMLALMALQVTDPYLNLFRGLVPPLLGTIDFTPLFGFLILQFLAGTLDLGAEDEW